MRIQIAHKSSAFCLGKRNPICISASRLQISPQVVVVLAALIAAAVVGGPKGNTASRWVAELTSNISQFPRLATLTCIVLVGHAK